VTRHARALLQVASALFLGGCMAFPGTAASQDTDGIQRNLLERRQQENEFHVRLYDNVPAPTRGAPDARSPAEAAPAPAGPAADAAARHQLYDSQLRRQLELQTQTRPQEELGRHEQSQLQQLQFDREIEAQRLQQQILRDSSSRMQQLR